MHILRVAFNNKERRVPFNPGISALKILAQSNLMARSDCGGTGACGACIIRVISGNVNNPTDKEGATLSSKQIQQGFRLACQTKPLGDVQINVENLTQEPAWSDYSANEYISVEFPSSKTSPFSRKHKLGIAVDLGTTQLRISFWDMQTMTRLAGFSGINPQAIYGSDVLSRLTTASISQKHAKEMSNMIKHAISDVIRLFHSRKLCDIKEIGHIVIVGNTPMLTLFTGNNYKLMLNVNSWSSFIDCSPKETKSLCGLWGINLDASVEIVEPLGGFVGSDVLAGVFAAKMTDNSGGALLIDFGTNSEIALWDGSCLWATSAAGGPAFEGSGISCGMPAGPGAIYKFEDNGSSSGFNYEVIGDDNAKGICGSGLVDIIAYLIERNIVNKAGLFRKDIVDKSFLILSGQNEIVLKKQDVDAFQRAKAAIGAGVICLLRKAGMNIKDLERIYVCGAFGRCLNIKNAQKIGLLPDITPQNIELCGNTSLAGCELLLFSPAKQEAIKLLKEKTRLINMSQAPRFEELFINNLYLQCMKME